MGFKALFATAVLAFAAGVGVGMATAGGGAPPSPPEAADSRLERLSTQIERLEQQLAEERARREALDQRAQRLYETLKGLHGRLVSQTDPAP